VELSSRRCPGSAGGVNDHVGPSRSAHQIGGDERDGDQFDPGRHGAPAARPYDRPHLPPSIPEVAHDVLADEAVGAGHGDTAAHRSRDALPVPGMTARLAP
jgi:hypothetical protein